MVRWTQRLLSVRWPCRLRGAVGLAAVRGWRCGFGEGCGEGWGRGAVEPSGEVGKLRRQRRCRSCGQTSGPGLMLGELSQWWGAARGAGGCT